MKKKFISFSMAILMIIGSLYAPGMIYAAETSVAPTQEESLSVTVETEQTEPVETTEEIGQTEPVETTEETKQTEPVETTEQTEPAKSEEVPEQTVLAESDEVAVEAITVYAETGIPAFVERLYTIVLDRASDPVGKAYWINQVQSGQTTGTALAAGFILSNEYKAKNTSNSDYVEMLYKTILNRNSDSTGKAHWLGKLEDGVSRNAVFAGVANSDEFRKLCSSYGISAGSWSSDEARDVNHAVTAFVQRLYRNILGRSGDANGINNWCNALLTGKGGAAIAANFILSNEYTAKNTSNSDYVEMLYKTILNRNPDSTGKANWLGRLEDGVSRKGVYAGFTNSDEFRKLCSSYGISAGSWSSDEARDVNHAATAFVQRLYKTILGRTADTDGLNHWCQKLQQGMGGTEIAANFIFSNEFKSKQISLKEYITLLYKVFLNREPDAAGLLDWTNQVKSGAHTAGTVVNGFAGSNEFKKLCSSYGISAGSANVNGNLPNVVTDGSFIYQATATTPALCKEMLELVNGARVEAGKTPDIWGDADLEAYALQRAKELQISFSHNHPDGTLTQGSEVIYQGSGGSSSPQRTFDAWMNSAGHKGTILSGITGKQYSMACAYIGTQSGTQYWIIVWR